MTITQAVFFRVVISTTDGQQHEYAVQAPDGLTAVETVFNNGLIPNTVNDISVNQFATTLVS